MWVFAGVRMLVACDDPDERPGDGTELSYSKLELDSLEDVKRLASGKAVQVTYNGPRRVVRPVAASKANGESKPARKRGA
jgi:hypothetical protein